MTTTKIRLMQNESKTKRKTSSVQEMMKRLAEFAKSSNNIDAAAEESDDASDLHCLYVIVQLMVLKKVARTHQNRSWDG